MRVRQAVAARLIALLEDERELESRPIREVRDDLRLLGMDPAAQIGQARRLAGTTGSPTGFLLARIADAEATEREIAELEGAGIEEVHAHLRSVASVTPAAGGSARSHGVADGAGRAPLDASVARRERSSALLSPPVMVGLLRLSDAAIVLLAGVLAYVTRFHGLEDYGTLELQAGVLAALLTINIFQLAGLYSFAWLPNLFGQSGRLLLAWSAVMLTLLALGFITKAPLIGTSRLWVGLWFVGGLFGLFTTRLLLKQQIRRWQVDGRLTCRVAIIGAGEHGRQLIEHLLRRGDPAIEVVGVFAEGAEPSSGELSGVPVRGTVTDLPAFARRHPVDQIIVALPWDAAPLLQGWMKELQTLPVDVSFCPQAADSGLAHSRITRVAGLPMLSVQEKPLAGWSYVAKAMEDRVLAAVILFVVAPLLGLIALLIKLDSPGPVLFRQKRYGLSNEVIEVFKFRTLYLEHCDDLQVVQVTRNDPRVTRVGRILRRTSLDELPQFTNVLMGTMSIVGPRPHAVAHDERYARLIEAYLARRRVKPGITGWAQVNGLRGEIDSLERMEQRVRHDLYYIENWSLLFDLRIILRTALVAFRDSYAY